MAQVVAQEDHTYCTQAHDTPTANNSLSFVSRCFCWFGTDADAWFPARWIDLTRWVCGCNISHVLSYKSFYDIFLQRETPINSKKRKA